MATSVYPTCHRWCQDGVPRGAMLCPVYPSGLNLKCKDISRLAAATPCRRASTFLPRMGPAPMGQPSHSLVGRSSSWTRLAGGQEGRLTAQDMPSSSGSLRCQKTRLLSSKKTLLSGEPFPRRLTGFLTPRSLLRAVLCCTLAGKMPPGWV